MVCVQDLPMNWCFPFTSGAAVVTLTSTLGGRQAACPGEVVTYTCTALHTTVAGWNVPPDIMEYDYFTRSQIGQQIIITVFKLALTNKVLDPNNAALADLTTTLTVTATAGQNGTVVECHGDEPSETMNLVLSVTSEHNMYLCSLHIVACFKSA